MRETHAWADWELDILENQNPLLDVVFMVELQSNAPALLEQPEAWQHLLGGVAYERYPKSFGGCSYSLVRSNRGDCGLRNCQSRRCTSGGIQMVHVEKWLCKAPLSYKKICRSDAPRHHGAPTGDLRRSCQWEQARQPQGELEASNQGGELPQSSSERKSIQGSDREEGLRTLGCSDHGELSQSLLGAVRYARGGRPCL